MQQMDKVEASRSVVKRDASRVLINPEGRKRSLKMLTSQTGVTKFKVGNFRVE